MGYLGRAVEFTAKNSVNVNNSAYIILEELFEKSNWIQGKKKRIRNLERVIREGLLNLR